MTHETPKQIFTKPFARRLSHAMVMILTFFSVCIGGALVSLLAVSPGTPIPFRDHSGKLLLAGISEKRFVTINGARQGMFIRGMDKTKPVLLFLHGGPGMPEFAISQKYPTVLEEHFVVCWWEQRGSGLSFSPNIPPSTMNAAQLVSDTLAVTNYLQSSFGQDKIYLMAHSGGSFFGIQAASQAPQLYHAYIGVAQISWQLASEKRAYSYMVEQFTKGGNDDMVAKLTAIPLPQMDVMPPAYAKLRDEAMHSLGIGTTHKMRSVVRGIFMPIMLSPAYTMGEKINIWRGKWSEASTYLWSNILATDLTVTVRKLDVPVYFISGIYDHTVSYALAKDYFKKLEAPVKGFYTFKNSAHSPLFEEPERFGRVLKQDVLTGTTTLADAITPHGGVPKP